MRIDSFCIYVTKSSKIKSANGYIMTPIVSCFVQQVSREMNKNYQLVNRLLFE